MRLAEDQLQLSESVGHEALAKKAKLHHELEMEVDKKRRWSLHEEEAVREVVVVVLVSDTEGSECLVITVDALHKAGLTVDRLKQQLGLGSNRRDLYDSKTRKSCGPEDEHDGGDPSSIISGQVMSLVSLLSDLASDRSLAVFTPDTSDRIVLAGYLALHA